MRYVVSIYSLFMYLITWPVLLGIYVPCERLRWKPCGTEVGITPWFLAPVHCVGNIAPFVTIRSLASKFANGYIASQLDEYEQLSYLKDRTFFSFKPHENELLMAALGFLMVIVSPEITILDWYHPLSLLPS